MKIRSCILTLLLCTAGLSFSSKTKAQCCNVFASNGTAVVTSGANCATLSYPTTVCEQWLIGIITVDIWIFYDNAFADVRFATDSDELTAASYEPLDRVVNAMKNSRYTLKVSGYADSTGTEEYNKDLSERRARTVRKYLVDKGVEPNRVVLAAYGEKMPKAPNRTRKGRAINRRVEFDLY